ncbi:MAG: 2-amino-4-oxopentanoate thiolase subunit OrtA [bacterium]|jgi:hypothetical protein
MEETGKQGDWVMVHQVILTAEERAPQVPADTKAVPLELRVKGFLTQAAKLGETATIRTVNGRKITGKLLEVNPQYTHTFGSPLPELQAIGAELRTLLREGC